MGEKIFLVLFAGVLFLGFIVMWAIFSLIIAIPIYYLWNWLMPELFGLTVVTYWQAWGLSVLAAILFKGTSSSSSSK